MAGFMLGKEAEVTLEEMKGSTLGSALLPRQCTTPVLSVSEQPTEGRPLQPGLPDSWAALMLGVP